REPARPPARLRWRERRCAGSCFPRAHSLRSRPLPSPSRMHPTWATYSAELGQVRVREERWTECVAGFEEFLRGLRGSLNVQRTRSLFSCGERSAPEAPGEGATDLNCDRTAVWGGINPRL